MSTESPRLQHYYFVHQYLREKCLKAPVAALRDFHHEKAVEHQRIAWVTIGLLHKGKDEQFIDSDGIDVVPFEFGGRFKGSVLVFPTPQRINEAFMSAILVEIIEDQSEEFGPSRYFTLEYSPRRPNETFIGQWNEDAHFNLGEGPVPTVDNFIESIRDLVGYTANSDPEDGAERVDPNALAEEFQKELEVAYREVDQGLVYDPTSDLAIEVVTRYALNRLVNRALEQGDLRLVDAIEYIGPNLVEDLKKIRDRADLDHGLG